MKCPNCNFENLDTVSYCCNCGTKLVPNQVPQEAPVSTSENEKKCCPNPKCPNYGKMTLPSDAMFCPDCGTKLSVGVPQEPRQDDRPSEVPSRSLLDEAAEVQVVNGVTYHKLQVKNPDDFEAGRDVSDIQWKHLNDNCNGQLFVGNNGRMICAKCGDTHPMLEYIFNPEAKGLQWAGDGYVGKQSDMASVVGQLVKKAGMDWQMQVLEHLI